MVSSQSPHPIPPSQPALLNASNLELLVTPHEKNHVQEFVASQSRYAKAQANEGRAVCASWGISTPEKNKMHLHQPSAGFETPVLRPRATQIQAGPEHRRHPSSPHSKSSTDKQTTQSPKKVKTSRAVREADSPERQKKQGKKTSTAKKSGRSNQARKERHARSDTDEEHLASVSFYFHSQPCNEIYGCDRAYRTTGAQACKTRDHEPTRSQDRQGGKRKQERRTRV